MMTTTPARQSGMLGAGPEWTARVELAALHRVIALNGWDDHVFTHLSARVPGEPDHMLLTPLGVLFSEVSASSLVKATFRGEPVGGQSKLNPAAVVIHGGIYAGAPHVQCVAHLHTAGNMAVSAHKDGLLRISQQAMCLTGNIAYHDYEGLALHDEERERLVQALGLKKILVLRNHGGLVCGSSIAEAFHLTFFFERACEMQVAALGAGSDSVYICDEQVAARTAADFATHPEVAEASWLAALRRVRAQAPGFEE